MDENFNPDQLLKDIDAILDSQGMSTVSSPSEPIEIEGDINSVLNNPVPQPIEDVKLDIDKPEEPDNNIIASVQAEVDTSVSSGIDAGNDSSFSAEDMMRVESNEESDVITEDAVTEDTINDDFAKNIDDKAIDTANDATNSKSVNRYASAGKDDSEMSSSKFTTIDAPKEWSIGDDVVLDDYEISPARSYDKPEEPVSYLEGASADGYAVENVAFGDISVGVETESVEYSEGHPFLRFLRNVLICVAVALVLSVVITKFIAHHTTVDGSSMENTLYDGDQLIVEELSYYMHEPERFDVIVFPTKTQENYIKRIIGLPGETVLISDSQIYINGNQLTESYGKEVIEDAGLASEAIYLGEDEYFVLGDNRNASVDSRSSDVGLIKREDIKGKAWLRFYPFYNFSTVK